MSRLEGLRILVLAALGVAGISVPFWNATYSIARLSEALAFAVVLIGLNLLTGDTGLVSLGHNWFFAIGAYVTANLVHIHQWTYYEALPVVVVVAAVAGVILGAPIVRLGGLNLALITLAIGFLTPSIAIRLTSLTGGSNGLTLGPISAPAWIDLSDTAWVYYLALVTAVIAYLTSFGIRRGPTGRKMRAIRDNRIAAESLGVHLSVVRTGVFAYSVILAGLGGWLFALAVGYVAPDSFNLDLGIAFLAGLVVGGLGYATAALIGGLFVEFIPVISGTVSQAFSGILQGAIIVLVMVVARRGIVGALEDAINRFVLRRRQPADAELPASTPVEAVR